MGKQTGDDDRQSRWWSVDPDGFPTGVLQPDDRHSRPCVGDHVLEAARTVATDIEATFGASRYFSNEEVRRLVFERDVPASVRPYAEASADLVQSVDDLWKWVSQIYVEKWGRQLTLVERKLIAEYAVWALLPDSPGNSPPLVRPTE